MRINGLFLSKRKNFFRTNAMKFQKIITIKQQKGIATFIKNFDNFWYFSYYFWHFCSSDKMHDAI